MFVRLHIWLAACAVVIQSMGNVYGIRVAASRSQADDIARVRKELWTTGKQLKLCHLMGSIRFFQRRHSRTCSPSCAGKRQAAKQEQAALQSHLAAEMDKLGVPPDYLDPRIPVEAFKAEMVPRHVMFAPPPELQHLGIGGPNGAGLQSIHPFTT